MIPSSVPNSPADIAAMIRSLELQKKDVEQRIKGCKSAIEAMFDAGDLAAKSDFKTAYSDGSVRTLRLLRKANGTYFKVKDDYRDDYSEESHALQQQYLDGGMAEMAEKASSWVVTEVKG